MPAVPRAALGTATSLRSPSYGWQAIYASLQQPVDFFCKEIMPGQHRREAPFEYFRASGSEGIADPADRESASLGGASPLSPTNFTESKPQQTGTGLLIRYGEVATTSGSTILRSEPASGWVRVKDALHSLPATEGCPRSGSELRMAGQSHCGME